MIHISFQQEDAEALLKSFEGEEFSTEEVISIGDDFSIGPIYDAESEGGMAPREDWRKLLTGTDEEKSPAVLSMEKIHMLREKMEGDPEKNIWMWVAPNACDVCGYYCLVTFLKEFMGRVNVLWLNNLPFINEKGQVFYPERLSDIPSREFIKARQLARPVTPAEFETDGEEWTKLVTSGEMLRIAEGSKKITGKEEDYLDKEILQILSTSPQKLQKILHQLHSKSKLHPAIEYLEWRISVLADARAISCIGNPAQPKTLEVSLSGGDGAEEAAGETSPEQTKESNA